VRARACVCVCVCRDNDERYVWSRNGIRSPDVTVVSIVFRKSVFPVTSEELFLLLIRHHRISRTRVIVIFPVCLYISISNPYSEYDLRNCSALSNLFARGSVFIRTYVRACVHLYLLLNNGRT
jgi:hypothetical protein